MEVSQAGQGLVFRLSEHSSSHCQWCAWRHPIKTKDPRYVIWVRFIGLTSTVVLLWRFELMSEIGSSSACCLEMHELLLLGSVVFAKLMAKRVFVLLYYIPIINCRFRRVGQSFSQSVSHTVSKSVRQWVNESVTDTGRSVGPSVLPSERPPARQPVGLSVNKSICHSIC